MEDPILHWLIIIVLSICYTSVVNPTSKSESVVGISQHWKVCDDSQVRPVDTLANGEEKTDSVMKVLRLPRYQKVSADGVTLEALWTVICKDCGASEPKPQNIPKTDRFNDLNWEENNSATKSSNKNVVVKQDSNKEGVVISCRPYVNLSQYDHLTGIAARSQLPTYPEPDVAHIFRRNGKTLASESRRLASSLATKPTVQVFNQIGNLLRVYGDSAGAVECFRRALAIQPNNPDVLLNLARILFNHKYLNDAITLTRRSLETQSPDRNAWLQHFTLGEILRAHGHLAEAVHHFKHAVALNPDFPPAQTQLLELDPTPPPLTAYTFAIILFLVLGVLVGLLTTAEANLDAYGEVMKTQRHFNRAMAMKTLKLSINPKVVRSRRQN